MAERNDVAARMSTGGEDRDARSIRKDIAARRESISETVDRLGERIQETLDWREYVSEHPLVAVGVAAGLGLIVAGIFKRKPTPRERIMDAVAETFEDMIDRVRGTVEDMVGGRKKMVSGRTVKAAVVTLITKAATDFVKNKASEALSGRERPVMQARRRSTTA